MVAIDIQQGLTDAWARIITFVPKFLGFLIILGVGYLVSKLVARLVAGLLTRVGFDRWIERGSLKTALTERGLDATDILRLVVFWTMFLLTLQLAFGVFGPNPISDLIHGIVAFLPNIFVAVLILVIAFAVAKVVTDVLAATLGAAPSGRWIARGAGGAVVLIGVFAALSQLQIAPAIVNGLFFAILAIIAGSAIVAIGGGGIQTMRGYWQRASEKADREGAAVRAAVAHDGPVADRVISVPDADPTSTVPLPPTPPSQAY